MVRRPPRSTLFPYTTLFRSAGMESVAYRFAEIFDRLRPTAKIDEVVVSGGALRDFPVWTQIIADVLGRDLTDRKSTRLNSSHGYISYAVFCLKKKKD